MHPYSIMSKLLVWSHEPPLWQSRLHSWRPGTLHRSTATASSPTLVLVLLPTPNHQSQPDRQEHGSHDLPPSDFYPFPGDSFPRRTSGCKVRLDSLRFRSRWSVDREE